MTLMVRPTAGRTILAMTTPTVMSTSPPPAFVLLAAPGGQPRPSTPPRRIVG
jgi:hypothetical protein